MAERHCAKPGCVEFPDAAWTYCAEHLAEEEARGAAWARAIAVPTNRENRSVEPTPCRIGPDFMCDAHPDGCPPITDYEGADRENGGER